MTFAGRNGVLLLEFAPGRVGPGEFDLDEVVGELD